jgi:hypothetical protein
MKTPFFLSVLLIGAVLAFVFTACANNNKDDIDKEYTVKYEITGPATVATSVGYKNATGGTDDLKNVNIPWSHTITVSGKNIGLFLAAGFGISNENTYTAKIYVDGSTKASSSGTYSVSASHVIQ